MSVNGHEINDYLDYSFYGAQPPLSLVWKNAKGRLKSGKIRSCDINSCGLSFSTYLMDEQRSCYNKCIFCFIDQMPRGMRQSLYFKDDDSRLSFLFGNYITLTNLSRRDADRIMEMHISPVNVSVHTMDPELRVKMMKNKHAGECLSYLKEFSDAGITVNAQLVLCPGINDGEQLRYSLLELAKLENVGSIAAVPVGLTRHREGLYPLESYTPQGAAEVISVIDEFNAGVSSRRGGALAFASDEFYLTAGIPFPDYAYYRDFPQLDNGVGLWVSTEDEFLSTLAELTPDGDTRRIGIATGTLAFPLIEKLSRAFCEKFPGADIRVYGIENRFFGRQVTVAGLVTGGDLIAQLKENRFDSPVLLLPSVMLRSGDDKVFLDDITPDEVASALHTDVAVSPCDGASLARTLYHTRTGG